MSFHDFPEYQPKALRKMIRMNVLMVNLHPEPTPIVQSSETWHCKWRKKIEKPSYLQKSKRKDRRGMAGESQIPSSNYTHTHTHIARHCLHICHLGSWTFTGEPAAVSRFTSPLWGRLALARPALQELLGRHNTHCGCPAILYQLIAHKHTHKIIQIKTVYYIYIFSIIREIVYTYIYIYVFIYIYIWICTCDMWLWIRREREKNEYFST